MSVTKNIVSVLNLYRQSLSVDIQMNLASYTLKQLLLTTTLEQRHMLFSVWKDIQLFFDFLGQHVVCFSEFPFGFYYWKTRSQRTILMFPMCISLFTGLNSYYLVTATAFR